MLRVDEGLSSLMGFRASGFSDFGNWGAGVFPRLRS